MTELKKSANHLPFRHIAVLGAGTMGAQIAAHFANAGARVELLDMPSPTGNRNGIVEQAFKRMTSLKPDPLFTPEAGSRIRLGNFDDHLDRLSTVDWVVEAVVERLDIKVDLFKRVEQVVSSRAIISTNTSGIPIADIASELSAAFRKQFLGTHFFNPPRYLKLCEIISGPDTDANVVDRVAEFVRVHLGKGVVLAKDSPYFIGNRIGIFAMMLAMKERSAHGFSIEEVDVLTGDLVGHPKSATFRTADVVGLDVMKAVISNLMEAIPHDESRAAFAVPEDLEKLVSMGNLGAKTSAGYYKKVGKDILSFEVGSGSYVPAGPIRLPGLEAISSVRRLALRLKALFKDDTKIGESFRRTTLGTLAYAARRIPEVSDSPADVDNAIKWGFGWEMGPFEIWDVLGREAVLEAMQDAQIEIPDWVTSMQSETFYVAGHAGSKGSVVQPGSEGPIPLRIASDESMYTGPSDVIWESEHTILRTLAPDVALLEFRSKANTLGNGVVAELVKAVRHTENNPEFKGLVVANTGSNFSVGANLGEVGMALMAGKVAMIDAAVKQFQMAMEVVRNSLKPVVVAAHSRVLGGATELMMSCRTPVAVAETYMGLVELGVGLIPAGTGCLRLMEKAAQKATGSSGSSGGFPNEIQANLAPYFQQVAMAKVSSSALEAVKMGYLSHHAPIVMREERRFFVAVAEIRRLSNIGYFPTSDAETVHVLGAPARAAFESMAYQMHQSGFISDYDRQLADELAFVMTGGDLPGDAFVPREYILDLERASFMKLLGQQKTQERIRSLLETGKPLRN